MAPDRAAVRIGCSGWNYREWRGDLYPAELPATRWLTAYAERFDTVEVNATFYRLPTEKAVARWVEQTPPGFGFTIKASRYLTHVRRLREIDDGVQRLLERIAPLTEADRLLAVLWQLPASFPRDDDRLQAALEALPPGRHAFEFRHPSWFAPDVLSALGQRDVALVRGDDSRRELPVRWSTASWAFARLHHGRRGRRGNYSDTELDHWADTLRRRAHDGQEVLVYCNNDWEGFAPRNAAGLLKRLGERPYDRAGTEPQPRRDRAARGD